MIEPLQNQLKHAHDDPVLDGLTIGSDHVFDMSLCFGEGSDGEGVGSIAEIMSSQILFKSNEEAMGIGRKHAKSLCFLNVNPNRIGVKYSLIVLGGGAS